VICVAVLVHVGAAYFTYRILKVLLSRCYKMLLRGVGDVGAAWRGEWKSKG